MSGKIGTLFYKKEINTVLVAFFIVLQFSKKIQKSLHICWAHKCEIVLIFFNQGTVEL